MAKATLKQRKAKPNSKYWKGKADDAWRDEIRAVGECEHCHSTDRQLNAHHIIVRTRLRFRHDLSNGVCLCVRCHSFDPTISPHQDSFGGENFLAWLKKERPGQFNWFNENKDNKMPMEGTYQDKYEELTQ